MTSFPPDVVAAILHHMNDDHTDDNLTIARAFVDPAATAATMTDLDTEGGTWDVVVDGGTRTQTVPWPGPVVERADVRRAVVALHDAAVERLGLPAPEAH
ncbi:DUF2470 domain-containing protein [Aeromicrobium sp. Root472D3]|uniref:DUF2470 domain-containing protein n=1 Tax=Aeromicrobium sp. Root472D3 TaxID=1736540 RepID=UPI00070124D2|nr:DUF2470 domain-containing protein [Aeromicrobium sp. Root472D3]KQX74068.1 hypothetical protein ASD10_02065 [Aeromicrobium sp. Root472D3]